MNENRSDIANNIANFIARQSFFEHLSMKLYQPQEGAFVRAMKLDNLHGDGPDFRKLDLNASEPKEKLWIVKFHPQLVISQNRESRRKSRKK